MKKILLICGRELNSFFSTWMAYIIAALVLLIDGLLFNSFAISNEPKFSFEVLADFFYFASGMSMVGGLLLSMRLIAEERQTKTIALLYTSPVSSRQIIYGKFLSVFIFSLFLLFLSLYMPALILVNGKISVGHLGAGYLSLILVGSVAMSMALFASTISPNQLIAGVLGAFILVAFLVLWMIADVVEPPFKDLLSYLAIHNKHFTPFSRGIINTQDLVFYISMGIFFLECSVQALESRRWQG